jgi:hypothetical protein
MNAVTMELCNRVEALELSGSHLHVQDVEDFPNWDHFDIRIGLAHGTDQMGEIIAIQCTRHRGIILRGGKPCGAVAVKVSVFYNRPRFINEETRYK